jgi:hypothetical protein
MTLMGLVLAILAVVVVITGVLVALNARRDEL